MAGDSSHLHVFTCLGEDGTSSGYSTKGKDTFPGNWRYTGVTQQGIPCSWLWLCNNSRKVTECICQRLARLFRYGSRLLKLKWSSRNGPLADVRLQFPACSYSSSSTILYLRHVIMIDATAAALPDLGDTGDMAKDQLPWNSHP